MSEESRFVIKFNETMANLFLDMKSIQKKYGFKRINTVILLQSLLEEKDSIFYDYLCATLAGQNPYKKIIQDCSRELNRLKKNEEDIDNTEKHFTIEIPNEEPIEANLTNELYNVITKTILDLVELKQNEEENDETQKMKIKM